MDELLSREKVIGILDTLSEDYRKRRLLFCADALDEAKRNVLLAETDEKVVSVEKTREAPRMVKVEPWYKGSDIGRDVYRCGYCGSQIDGKDRFCRYCGRKFTEKEVRK